MEVTIQKNKVTVSHQSEVKEFETTDQAWDYVEDVGGIPADEVDYAITELITNKHNKANFGVLKNFVFSELV